MPFVSRLNGQVFGVYDFPQSDVVTEWLPDGHPCVVGFKGKRCIPNDKTQVHASADQATEQASPVIATTRRANSA